ncbi:outer membrane beta-barrel protein [Aquimarina litoralis]|uniref:outer membrane beta-barrel protein n=1 Tax=Aquimarina litoralis TaxID=584605 RepID=UPI001C5752C9|nr:outer membrane beta-barrel protein [Aquimarina litoralis]MBW1293982.1 outer membrane beta-barrel protein [Aquimarina litoralis]
MRNLIFCSIALLLNSIMYSQIKFEKGYIVNNTNEKITCWIKNVDWGNNPSEFQYKLTENSNIEQGGLNQIKEFAVGTTKFVRAIVNIDKSSTNLNNLDAFEEPVFEEQKVFLKVLVEGEATLYSYQKFGLSRYFYKTTSLPITQLVYKVYRGKGGVIKYNMRFRSQLWESFNSEKYKANYFRSIDYKRRDLVRFFENYNSKDGVTNTEVKSKQKRKDIFNINLRVGINSSSFEIEELAAQQRNFEFGQKIGPRIGIEAEFILPFNKEKWSLLLEPSYQSYSSSKTFTFSPGNTQTTEVTYNSIEFPLGVRYYSFLSPSSKLFANVSYVFATDLSSSIDFELSDDIEINSSNNLAFGVGFKFKNTYSIEARYVLKRDLLNELTLFDSDFETFSLILGYKIL